jgi:hypothetical protein
MPRMMDSRGGSRKLRRRGHPHFSSPLLQSTQDAQDDGQQGWFQEAEEEGHQHFTSPLLQSQDYTPQTPAPRMPRMMDSRGGSRKLRRRGHQHFTSPLLQC